MTPRCEFKLTSVGSRSMGLCVYVNICLSVVTAIGEGISTTTLVEIDRFNDYSTEDRRFTETSHNQTSSPDIFLQAAWNNRFRKTNEQRLKVRTAAELDTTDNETRNNGFVNMFERRPGIRSNGTDPNTTSGCADNNTSLAETTGATPNWRIMMDVGLLTMVVTGVVANTLTLVTLTVNGRAFSRLTVVLLKHQSSVDVVVCALASGVFMQTSVWHVGLHAVDVVICFIWHSQYIYWAYVLLSVWNLVFIAFDRLIAVCYPLKYQTLSARSLKIAIAVIYVPCILSPAPSMGQVSFANGSCVLDITVSSDHLYGFYYAFSIYWLFVTYIIPVMLLLGLYGRIVLQLRRYRVTIASVSQSHTLTTSTIRVTKCAITVAFVFAMTISYDSIYFCLGNVGVLHYDLGQPLQLVGILLTVCNSLANPFMYTLFMPAFRRSLKTTICRRNAVQDVPLS